jgi:hypothetical protein
MRWSTRIRCRSIPRAFRALFLWFASCFSGPPEVERCGAAAR